MYRSRRWQVVGRLFILAGMKRPLLLLGATILCLSILGCEKTIREAHAPADGTALAGARR